VCCRHVLTNAASGTQESVESSRNRDNNAVPFNPKVCVLYDLSGRSHSF
jgi:hypothetical protein